MKSKTMVAAVVAASAVVGGAGAAYAAVGQGRTYTYTLDVQGVRFDSGTSTFYAQGVNRGGMSYAGVLRDTMKDDYSVKVQAKVMGYGYGGVVTASNGGSTRVNGYVYDGAATYVRYGWVQACVVKGFLPDSCTATGQMNR